MAEKKNLETIKKITSQILKLLGFGEAKLTASQKEDFIYLDIKTENPTSLIGQHGENIASLQLIVALITFKKLGKWKKIILNINNWRVEREEYLQKMALNLAQKVKFSHQAIQAPFLTPAERRIIHLYLSDHPDVVTYSEGEGRQRRLIVKPKPS